MGKRIDRTTAPRADGTGYPPPFDGPCLAAERVCLGDAAGLTQFGVNQLRLPPGAWSSQRHWEEAEDEFVFVLHGEVVLVTDGGEEVLGPGDCAGFRAGEPDGHCFQNRSPRDAVLLEVGTRRPGNRTAYPDIDLASLGDNGEGYARKDGTRYPVRPRRTGTE